MKVWILLLAALPAAAQPAIQTVFVNGTERADAYHLANGDAVSEREPATSGEMLLLNAGGLTPDTIVLLGGSPVVPTQVGDSSLQFVVPDQARGGFLEVQLQSAAGVSNAPSIAAQPAPGGVQLTASDVALIVKRAANAIDDPHIAVAVVDRAGRPLAVFARASAADSDIQRALSLARTGAFFSHNQAPLSSRTVLSLSTEHFPNIPGINNQAAPLFGIELTNRGCSLSSSYNPGQVVPTSRNLTQDGPSVGITTTPGGLPIYRNRNIAPGDIGNMVGGVGVAGIPPDAAEFATIAGVSPEYFVKTPLPEPQAVFADGIRLPFVTQTAHPAGTHPANLSDDDLSAGWLITPRDGDIEPEGYLIDPRAGAALSAGEVRSILENAIARAQKTRALIRLPLGTRAKFVLAVSDLDGTILGMYRMHDSTVFSIDVAATKARNVVYFSGPDVSPADLPPALPEGTAITNRTIGFGAQDYFPSGILNSSPGPFRSVFVYDRDHPCTQGQQPPNPNQSGIVFFPGSAPLYKAGKLVGGLGISGDGVDQDDYATSGGTAGFEPPAGIRADNFIIRGVRLPYMKFPRNPEQ